LEFEPFSVNETDKIYFSIDKMNKFRTGLQHFRNMLCPNTRKYRGHSEAQKWLSSGCG
jgi:hypothetical protein